MTTQVLTTGPLPAGKPVVGIIVLYGTPQAGHGWLAQTPKTWKPIGDGVATPGITATEALWDAANQLQDKLKIEQLTTDGVVAVSAPGGGQIAYFKLEENWPTYGELVFTPAPIITVADRPTAEPMPDIDVDQ